MKRSGYKDEGQFAQTARSLLLILSGPSGVGKDAVLSRIKGLDTRLEQVVTVTTRPKRPGEKDNVDYHFISDAEFHRMKHAGNLLEWAKVYGNWYGVPREPMKRALAEGKNAITRVDIQGAATIKKILPEAVFIFLMPPTMAELATRLEGRNTETASDLSLRLKTAKEEINKLPMFDYVVINRQGQINQVIADIKAIITAEQLRIIHREYNL
jgi:guanylate kinase